MTTVIVCPGCGGEITAYECAGTVTGMCYHCGRVWSEGKATHAIRRHIDCETCYYYAVHHSCDSAGREWMILPNAEEPKKTIRLSGCYYGHCGYGYMYDVPDAPACDHWRKAARKEGAE